MANIQITDCLIKMVKQHRCFNLTHLVIHQRRKTSQQIIVPYKKKPLITIQIAPKFPTCQNFLTSQNPTLGIDMDPIYIQLWYHHKIETITCDQLTVTVNVVWILKTEQLVLLELWRYPGFSNSLYACFSQSWLVTRFYIGCQHLSWIQL